ncbi:hypothetical protein M1512_01435 [Patescibacteria group bacterium]|nr:hypothetical protein [Patescibacteria group bacterium]
MKSPNKSPSSKNSLKTAVAVSALALAGRGIVANEASAATRPQANAKHVDKKTLFRDLTNLVVRLDKGGEVTVTAKEIDIPGPIDEAKGSPIVFKANGQTYFAFTQDHTPNFNQKRPADVARDMAVVEQPSTDPHIQLEYAHLNKAGTLVDENGMPVGYSAGGNSTGK